MVEVGSIEGSVLLGRIGLTIRRTLLFTNVGERLRESAIINFHTVSKNVKFIYSAFGS